MAKSSSQSSLPNRAPRVQIEYDVELYGAEKKVELPLSWAGGLTWPATSRATSCGGDP